MMTLTEVAKLLDVAFYRIQYAIKAGHVAEPKVFAGRYMYTQEDIDRLRDYFNHKVLKAPKPKQHLGNYTPETLRFYGYEDLDA